MCSSTKNSECTRTIYMWRERFNVPASVRIEGKMNEIERSGQRPRCVRVPMVKVASCGKIWRLPESMMKKKLVAQRQDKMYNMQIEDK
ncbi:hypothetical protein BELL_0336g00020 [Botrytis elliptica]|uniref:Uncharacterized protein n=1 Tax=Botrytis elliptica TaxID=278938 RepID=A0A4Z1JXS1_9HELO|nr:hypothetical protein BELL_0336g00020 [Botrytis elliptica]